MPGYHPNVSVEQNWMAIIPRVGNKITEILQAAIWSRLVKDYVEYEFSVYWHVPKSPVDSK